MEDALAVTLPKTLASQLRSSYPVEVSIDGEAVPLVASAEGANGTLGSLAVSLIFEKLAANSISWIVKLANTGDVDLSGVSVAPLRLLFDLDPSVRLPRIRHLTGSWHYDAEYPPRAFRVNEEAFLTHDHTQRVVIGGANSGAHSPILQFAVDDASGLSGFFVGFEWSAGWRLSAGWEKESFHAETRSDFLVDGSMDLGTIHLRPGDTLESPRVHLGVFSGAGWNDLDNAQRKYLREIAPSASGIDRHPVSYDHWFGLYEDFTVEDLMQQATRAAEIGCEAFCLDACWYKSEDVMSGLGNWTEPDPRRFPNGVADIVRLGAHVRSLGMRFGLWHILQLSAPGSSAAETNPALFRMLANRESFERNMRNFGRIEQTDDPEYGAFSGLRLKLEDPAGVSFALDMLRHWVLEWGVTWFRFECVPEDGVEYNRGFNLVLDTLRDEFPDVYVEACNGGGQRLDINSVVRAHGNWLSDHTSNPDVTRFTQAGALRFWPSHMLNLALVSFEGRGDQNTTVREVLSRMLGVLSFNGDIAQWSDTASARISAAVNVYKSIRGVLDGEVYFPLPQPRSVDDWDAVLFHEQSSGAVALFVFRTSGPESQYLDLKPFADLGSLNLALATEGASISAEAAGVRISLPKGAAALWTNLAGIAG
jgi:Melibiase